MVYVSSQGGFDGMAVVILVIDMLLKSPECWQAEIIKEGQRGLSLLRLIIRRMVRRFFMQKTGKNQFLFCVCASGGQASLFF